MADFTYIARDAAGQKISGTMSAATERDVVNQLRGKSLFPVTIDEAQAKKSLSFGRGVSGQKIAIFYDQLASLMKNGVPLLRALSVLRDQTSIPALQAALDDIISRIEDGESLGDAFACHPKVFSEMAVNMARAGTEGGFLEDALARVALFTEQQDELKSRTVGALIYPAVLASIGTLVVAVLLVFFVPKFGEMFDALREKNQLPPITDWLLSFSGFLQTYGIFILLGFAVLYFALRVQLRTERGRQLADRIKIKLPLFGMIFLNLAVARFCRVLGTLLHNGVPILKGLKISSDAAGNQVLSQAINDATENITAGASLSVPLESSGHFPQNVTEMISVAEESNTLDTVLVNIADGLEKQTTRRLDLLVKLIEPLMLLVMAIVILIVVIALLLPVMKMGQALQG
ncbi:MAG: type II secretion system F family protein [Planctomycetota bacterium]|jgi:general secretion pathway protein F/type IV pilus assembly protein PilC|nr:type II secretion system F family protein [Planctomycetota bacterium]